MSNSAKSSREIIYWGAFSDVGRIPRGEKGWYLLGEVTYIPFWFPFKSCLLCTQSRLET